MITDNLEQLLEAGVQYVRLGSKAGTYHSCRTKQGATHRILAIPGSVLVEPLRKPRKNRRLPAPFQRYSQFNDDTMQDHSQIPAGATHVCYTTSTGRVEIIAQVSAASDFEHMRGTLRYGIYHAASDRFRSLMPQDKNDPYLTDRDPMPCRCPINEHRTMKAEVPVATAQAVPPAPKAPRAAKAAPAEPRAPRVPAVPGAAPARPAAGSKTAAVWDAADALAKELGREPAKAELVAKLPGHNPSTISVQFSAWRKARHQAG